METVNPNSPWNSGGLLRPGWTRDTNRTAKPERVLTADQTRRLRERGAAEEGGE